jgi:hypothetical protein
MEGFFKLLCVVDKEGDELIGDELIVVLWIF